VRRRNASTSSMRKRTSLSNGAVIAGRPRNHVTRGPGEQNASPFAGPLVPWSLGTVVSFVEGPFRQGDARGLVLARAQRIIRLQQRVDLAGALVNDGTLGVAKEALDGIFIGITVGTVDLYRVARSLLRRHRGVPLRERSLAGVAHPLVLHPSRAQIQQAADLVVPRHARDHLLDELVLADGPAKGPALPRVTRAAVKTGPDETGRSRRHGIPTLIQRKHRDMEPLTLLTEAVVFGHPHLVHHDRSGVAGTDAQLAVNRRSGDSLHLAGDEERREAAVIPLLLFDRVGPCDYQILIAEVSHLHPGLFPVENILPLVPRLR